jgi:hypothetical protein
MVGGSPGKAMSMEREGHGKAVEQFEAARDERDRRSNQLEAANGSQGELAAFTELKAAEDQFAAREAWLKWTERDD